MNVAFANVRAIPGSRANQQIGLRHIRQRTGCADRYTLAYVAMQLAFMEDLRAAAQAALNRNDDRRGRHRVRDPETSARAHGRSRHGGDASRGRRYEEAIATARQRGVDRPMLDKQ
jgi:hypothetical protein